MICIVVVALTGCGIFSRDDDTLAPAELVEFSPSLEVERLWSTDTGRGMSRSRPNFRPYFDGGRIWTGDHRGRVVAVNADSGRVEQRFDTDLALSAGPAVQDGLILLGSFDGDVVVLDAETGEERWRARVSSEVLSYPALADGVVVARSIDGRVYGFDVENGRRIWVHDRSVPLLTLRGTSDPLVRAGQVFIGYDDGMVSALRVRDGSVLWEQRVSQPEGRTELERMADIDGPMAIVGTELYVVTYHGRMAGMALESGRMMWVKDLSSHTGLSLRRTQLAASDNDDAVWLVDRRNGATLWRDEQLKRRQITRPVFYGSQIVVVDVEGYMHFYDIDSGEFSARTQFSRNAPADAPLVVGNTLYMLDENGTLSAWRAGRPSS
ncbi:outer membrane protein assembly factor BamB [Wenzhouxiangella sp. AB-CW3]|uniref:outer membrane protein assembly factor BamB n=1 Tax=Wenzhouxiangella sp. AB-CW3 TaxID=2771012 RepID=UPI00168B88E1|nr:outer membrane protein assembly factor BamB [Wenzhouxiangella sp. AB-CW3]QOC23986.1 outer membrane protein assembly factor BamB [Wenzhouxiangella sp. AB-CW3]